MAATNNFNTDSLARALVMQTIAQPFRFEPRKLTQARLEAMTDRAKKVPFSVAENVKVLASYLVPVMSSAAYEPEPTMTADEIEAETIRLNGLPKDQQLVIFCQAMGFDVRDYLTEKARFNAEAQTDVDMLELGGEE